MTRDYGKQKVKRPRHINKFYLALFIGACVGMLFFTLYRNVVHKHELVFSMVKSVLKTKTTEYFPALFAKSHPAVAKKSAVAEESAKPVHFDFYDDLPKLQVELSQPSNKAPTLTPAAPPKVALVSKAAPELGESYLLEIAEFRNFSMASRYRMALSSAGIKAEIAKIRTPNEYLYRVQQGPYLNTQQLQFAQRQLQRRGITCVIRKATPYKEERKVLI